MKKLVSSVLILAMIIIMNSVSVHAAKGDNIEKQEVQNAHNIIASPIEAIKVLDNQISQLPMNAFNKKDKPECIKNYLKASLNKNIKELEDGNYALVFNEIIKEVKAYIQKHIVLSEQQKLERSIEIILEAIENARKSTVKTNSGNVAGFLTESDCWTWMGIPYAEAPVGKLRWKAPVDHKPWKGIRFSTYDFPCGVQLKTTPYWSPLEEYIGSEDCLYLNIFRPRTVEKNLPVYFWVHGGGNMAGKASDYNAANLATKSNMVVVVIQYRLGPMGWLTHPALNSVGTEEEKSGNYGTLDMIKALKWVNRNISEFGGDAQNITIAGESAGGANVLNLMISPLAKGLFHKAIVESAGITNISVDAGVERTNSYIDRLLMADKKYSDLSEAASYRASMSNKQIEEYLRSKSAQEIQNVMYLGANPFIDGKVITGTFSSVFESGNYNKVPIIIGSNEDEAKPLLLVKYGFLDTSTGKLWSDLYSVLGLNDKLMTLEEIMPHNSDDREFYENLSKYPSIFWKAFSVDSLARSLKKHQDDVYCYYFKWKGKGAKMPFDFIIGAGHGFELPFFFGWDTDIFGNISYTEENKKGREKLQKAIMSYTASFTATGTPNEQSNADRPCWEQWSNMPEGAKSIIFDADLENSKISMMNEEFKMQDILTELETLPWRQKYLIWDFMDYIFNNWRDMINGA